MSQYKQVQFEHQSDEDHYRKYFPTESGIGNYIGTVYERMGESRASLLFRGTKRGYPYTVKVYKEKLPQSRDDINKRMEKLKELEHHPRVCRVLNFIDYEAEDRSYSYVVMDFTDGIGLDKAIEEEPGRKFPQSMVLNWAYQLLEGLKFLHEKELSIHLKLSNIVRRRDGSICISDISHLVSQRGEESPPDSNIPDEQASNNSILAVDFHEKQVRRDIFHLGSVLFELLTGAQLVKTWPNADKKQLLMDSGVSDDVADIVVKAVDEERMNRWKDAPEMMRALEHLPLDSQDNRQFMVTVFRDILTVILGFTIGLTVLCIGRYQVNRNQEITLMTQRAEEAWDAGRFTQAWDAMTLAMEKKSCFDPMPSAKTVREAAEYLGVYRLNDGYLPAYSAELAGQALSVGLSPQGNAVAVMTREMDALSMRAVRRIHLLNPENGVDLASAFRASITAAPEFLFLGDNVIAYVNERGQFAAYNWTLLQTYEYHPSSAHAVRVALSGNGEVVACLCEDGSIHTARSDAIKQGTAEWLPVNSEPLPQDSTKAPEDRLFVLDYSGKNIAVSIVGDKTSDVRIYSVGNPNPKKIHSFIEPYDHFEGGFYKDNVAVAGWRFKDDLADTSVADQNAYISGFHAIPLNDGEVFSRYYGTTVHAFADEDGIYFSGSKAEVNRLSLSPDPNTKKNGWSLKAPLSVDANVRLLRHIPGYILTITEKDTVALLRDDGTEVLLVSEGVNFFKAVMSDRRLFLFAQDNDMTSSTRDTLSAFEWTDAEVFLNYDGDIERHQRFQVLEDKSSAMFYGLEPGANKIFRIVPVDKSKEPVSADSDGAAELQNLVYLRPVAASDPSGEYLKEIREQDAIYYSAVTGIPSAPEGTYQQESLTAGVFRTKSYLLRKNSSDQLEVQRVDDKRVIGTAPAVGLLTGATQRQDSQILFVSLIDEQNAPYCLLLDSNFEIIARLQGAFTMSSDGTLYRDDNKGRIIQGKTYSKEELADILLKGAEEANR